MKTRLLWIVGTGLLAACFLQVAVSEVALQRQWDSFADDRVSLQTGSEYWIGTRGTSEQELRAGLQGPTTDLRHGLHR